MTQFRVFIDGTSPAGQQTIAGIQTQGSTFGVGISTNISAGIVTAVRFFGDGSSLTNIVSTGTGVQVRDNNVLVGVASVINFGSNLTATFSSGQATIDSTSGSTLPQNSQSTSYFLQASDAGKHVAITTGGVTLNSSVFSVGDVVTIYNNSASVQMINVGSGVSMRRVSIGDTGSRGLNGYGLASILCIGTNSYVISGAGVT